MSESTTLEHTVAHFLRTVPETWADFDPSKLSELQARAVDLLTAAGMVERRVTLRLRLIGQPVAVEATITMNGETGLVQAMEFVLKDLWNDWREAFEQAGDGSVSHCERIGSERWRLTTEGVLARNDHDAGNPARVFDFVLKREFFDKRPRLMPDGRLGQRMPVAGRGMLERIRRVSSDAGPANVAIANWDAGAQAFAKVIAELMKAKLEPVPPATVGHPSFALLRVFTNGIVDDRINDAAQVLADETPTANEKLTKIDGLIRFPPTASASARDCSGNSPRTAAFRAFALDRRPRRRRRAGRHAGGNRNPGPRRSAVETSRIGPGSSRPLGTGPCLSRRRDPPRRCRGCGTDAFPWGGSRCWSVGPARASRSSPATWPPA